SSRLDAAAKEDALEAGKLQAAFKRELAEALGALAERQEAILLKAADAGRLHALELQKSRERIEALEARLLEFASRPPAPPDPGLLSRIEALAAELGSFAPRLDAAAKEGSQEAGKLRAAFKRELAEALGAFAGELEGWILQGAKRNRGALPEREFSGPQNGVGDSGPVAAAAAKSGGELTGLVAGRLGEIQAILRKLSSEADAAGPGADKALELLKNARSVTDTMAGSTDAGLLQTLLGYLDKCVAGAVEQLARAQAAAEEAGGLPDVPLKMRVRLHVAALEAAIRSLEGLAAFHASRSRR
ncbi:MAG: hypothetical protein HY550_09435, partial [Elusimicrobia bacterium]|nr:hypothetical protein [Elusimicrobiota bacterium]